MLKHQHQVLLDPKFWQALGKSLGWDGDAPEGFIAFKDLPDPLPSQRFYWQYQWHSFINHLTEGKDPEEFFTKLLK